MAEEELEELEEELEIEEVDVTNEEEKEEAFSEFLKKNESQKAGKNGPFRRYSVRTNLSNIRLEGGVVLTGVDCILKEYNARSHFHALERFLNDMKKAVGGSEKEALEKCKLIFGNKIEILSYDGKNSKLKKMSF